jgi:hypothetical protein
MNASDKHSSFFVMASAAKKMASFITLEPSFWHLEINLKENFVDAKPFCLLDILSTYQIAYKK